MYEVWGKPGDIDSGLTLREFDLAVQAYQTKQKHNQRLAAWHVHWLVNLWAKGKHTPASLLGEKDNKQGKMFSIADIEEREKQAAKSAKVADKSAPKGALDTLSPDAKALIDKLRVNAEQAKKATG